MDREEFEYALERTFEQKQAAFRRAFDSHACEAYMVISEYFFYPKGSNQEIGIRITINLSGEYGYCCSHGSGYRSSINRCYDSEEEALHNAFFEALSDYSEEDENRDEKWVCNEDYYLM